MAPKVKRTILVDVEGIVKGKNDAFVLAVARQGVARAKALAPKDKGGLRASISAKMEGKGKARYGSPLEYSAIQEFGGTIRPKTAKALKFKVNGQWRTAKSVTIQAKPYLRPSADWLKTNGSKLYARLLKGALKRG